MSSPALPRRAPRTRGALLLVLLCTALASACIPLDGDEQYLYDRTNQLRHEAGLPNLLVHDSLTRRAQHLADDLAARRELAHSDLRQFGFSWATAGENLGRGPGIHEVTDKLIASPGHRANMLNPAFISQRVGVARAADGTVYVVHLFSG
ncbi:MAG: CAP domain-containing protein [Acidimicrobiia bacterium]